MLCVSAYTEQVLKRACRGPSGSAIMRALHMPGSPGLRAQAPTVSCYAALYCRLLLTRCTACYQHRVSLSRAEHASWVHRQLDILWAEGVLLAAFKFETLLCAVWN
eukprot:1413295-Rhodomonas_salina.3